jgi:hypothetical protein
MACAALARRYAKAAILAAEPKALQPQIA